MFKAIPKYKQGILAVLALLLVAVACDTDSPTAALPPDASQEQPPVGQAEELAFSPEDVYRKSIYSKARPHMLFGYFYKSFETAETRDLYIRSMLEEGATLELVDTTKLGGPVDVRDYTYQELVAEIPLHQKMVAAQKSSPFGGVSYEEIVLSVPADAPRRRLAVQR